VPVNMVPISQFDAGVKEVEDTGGMVPVRRDDADAKRAYALIVSDVLTRVVQKERRATERAMHKHNRAGFAAWAEEFYTELHGAITQALDAPLRAFCWMCSLDDSTPAAEEADRYAYYHVGLAKEQLADSFPLMYEIDIDERADRIVDGLLGRMKP